MSLLTVADLAVAYGRIQAVQGVALDIAAGSIVTVIGANGAGKTSLLNAVMGLLPARGEVTFRGEAMARCPTEKRFSLGMSLVTESRDLFTTMSIEDNLILGANRCGRREIVQRMAEVFARFPRLKERSTQLAGTLSGGERQMLAMGRALMARPQLLMLDEPSLGLAPIIVREIFHIISDLRDNGVAILLVEQNARAALQVADYAYVMELGLVTMDGPASQLAGDPRVIESYLGFGGADTNTA